MKIPIEAWQEKFGNTLKFCHQKTSPNLKAES